MKKVFLIQAVICVLFTSQAQVRFSDGDNYIYTVIRSGEVELTEYSSIGVDDVIIPSNVTYKDTSYKVTSIADNAFKVGCSSLIVPNTINNIGKYALFTDGANSISVAKDNSIYDSRDNCNAIIHTQSNTLIVGCANTHIPNSVVAIGDYAFYMCDFHSVYIPASVISIGEGALMSCNKLTSISVAEDNPVYDSRDNSNALIHTRSNTLIAGCENTIIPNTVKAIGDYAFSSCGMTSITIPNSVIAIGEGCFEECSRMTSIHLPNSLTSIGDGAFRNCSSLTLVTIPNAVSTIGHRAFYGCYGLTSITIPNSVIQIGERAFEGCDRITSIIIPASVTSIGTMAFGRNLSSIIVDKNNPIYDSRNNCNAIIHTRSNKLVVGCENTTIPNTVVAIGERAFNDCKLTSINIPNSVASIESRAFNYCGFSSIIIPNSVTTIGPEAFSNSYELTSVTLPVSVTSIGANIFNGCENLVSIRVDKNNPVYDSRDNCNAVIHTSSNTLVASCKSTIIPASVTSIGKKAFAFNGLNSIDIPNSVTSIGDSAFWVCSNLTSITIPNSVTSIGTGAFNGCSGLEGISIPSSVMYIGDGTFDGCGRLFDIMIDENHPVYAIQEDGMWIRVVEKHTGRIVSEIYLVE